MLFQPINSTKLLATLFLSTLFWTSSAYAMLEEDNNNQTLSTHYTKRKASVATTTARSVTSDYVDEDRSVRVRQLPEDLQKRGEIIESIFKDTETSVFDLSSSNIRDADIPFMTAGFTKGGKRTIGLKLLDLNTPGITRDGIVKLLRYFQNGEIVQGQKFYPDVRQTIIKVSADIDLTDELLSDWQKIAPSVFAGGLVIVE